MHIRIPKYSAPPGEKIPNILALLAICFALFTALYYEFVLHEPPCPLCALQRLGLILVGIGTAMNIRFEAKVSHYSLVLLGGIATGAAALRQILLHVCPGTKAYGSPFLGLHFYTWAAISAVLVVVFVVAMLIYREYVTNTDSNSITMLFGFIATLAFFILTSANVTSIISRFRFDWI
ncbi:disulfide bond formation protein B [Burkholderia cenocepacia]|uniref:disulfide bond formation protein B n=1 Tax=Burkholderia cenocepacia TaxID=95486 RepID=UPI002AC361D3|nr:disulfide bond formation protein B [Burkholderia cenocepacia]